MKPPTINVKFRKLTPLGFCKVHVSDFDPSVENSQPRKSNSIGTNSKEVRAKNLITFCTFLLVIAIENTQRTVAGQ